MDWGAILTAVAGSTWLGAAGQYFRTQQTRAHEQVRRDVELWSSLPAESTSRKALLADIDRRILQMIEAGKKNRRDPAGIALAAVLLFWAVGLGLWIVQMAGPWRHLLWLPALFLAMLGAAGMARSLPSVERDEKGRPLS